MPYVSFAQLLGAAGVTTGVLATWFQYQRILRVGVDGVSLATWYQFALMAVFWMAYGVAVDSVIVVLGSSLVFPLQIGIVRRLGPWRHRAVVARATVFIVSCCLVPTVLFGWAGGALGTGVAMAANRLPQIVKLLRHAGDLGVSATSWAVSAVCSVLWTGYYFGTNLTAPLLATVAGLVGNVTIATLAAWRHQQAAANLDSVGPLAGRTEGARHSLETQR